MECSVANCSNINLTSCQPLFSYDVYSNESEDYLMEEDLIDLYDEDGCFYTDLQRRTQRYETYMNFSLCMGILTIGRQ